MEMGGGSNGLSDYIKYFIGSKQSFIDNVNTNKLSFSKRQIIDVNGSNYCFYDNFTTDKEITNFWELPLYPSHLDSFRLEIVYNGDGIGEPCGETLEYLLYYHNKAEDAFGEIAYKIFNQLQEIYGVLNEEAVTGGDYSNFIIRAGYDFNNWCFAIYLHFEEYISCTWYYTDTMSSVLHGKISFDGTSQLESLVSLLLLDCNTLIDNYTTLNTKYNTLNGQYTNLNNSYKALKDKDTELSTELSNVSKKNELLTTNYTTLSEEYDSLNTKYTTLNNNYETLSTNYDSLSESNTTLQNNYTTLKKNYDTLNTSNTTLTNNYNTLNTNYSALNTKCTNLEKSNTTLSTNYDTLSNKCTELEEANTTLTSTCNDLSNKCTSLETTNNTLTTNYNNLSKKCTDLETSNSTLSTNYTNLSKKYTDLETSNLTLSDNYNDLSTKYTSLKTSNDTLTTNYDSLNTKYTTLSGNYTTLNNNYTSLSNSNSLLETKYNTLNTNYTTLKGNYDTLKTSNDDLTTKYTNLLKVDEGLTTKCTSLESLIKNISTGSGGVVLLSKDFKNSIILNDKLRENIYNAFTTGSIVNHNKATGHLNTYGIALLDSISFTCEIDYKTTTITVDEETGDFSVDLPYNTWSFSFVKDFNEYIDQIYSLPLYNGINIDNLLVSGEPNAPLMFDPGFVPGTHILSAKNAFLYRKFNDDMGLYFIGVVEDATGMFDHASGLNNAFSIGFVGNMDYTFYGCLDIVNVQFTNIITPTSMINTFSLSIELKSINFVNKDENGVVTNNVDFSNCKDITNTFKSTLGTYNNNIKIGSMPGLGACKDTKQMTLDLTQACTSTTELSFDCSEFAKVPEPHLSSGEIVDDTSLYYSRTLALHKNQYNLFKDTDEYNKLLAKGWTVTST